MTILIVCVPRNYQPVALYCQTFARAQIRNACVSQSSCCAKFKILTEYPNRRQLRYERRCENLIKGFFDATVKLQFHCVLCKCGLITFYATFQRDKLNFSRITINGSFVICLEFCLIHWFRCWELVENSPVTSRGPFSSIQ